MKDKQLEFEYEDGGNILAIEVNILGDMCVTVDIKGVQVRGNSEFMVDKISKYLRKAIPEDNNESNSDRV